MAFCCSWTVQCPR